MHRQLSVNITPNNLEHLSSVHFVAVNAPRHHPRQVDHVFNLRIMRNLLENVRAVDGLSQEHRDDRLRILAPRSSRHLPDLRPGLHFLQVLNPERLPSRPALAWLEKAEINCLIVEAEATSFPRRYIHSTEINLAPSVRSSAETQTCAGPDLYLVGDLLKPLVSAPCLCELPVRWHSSHPPDG